MNHKFKGNRNQHKGCGLCKPWKRIGNSRKMATKKQRIADKEIRTLVAERLKDLPDNIKVSIG